ncbi:MAG: helical backbone metal receptor [bacterium]|nr:helical backbone metal receptor [bacterium]
MFRHRFVLTLVSILALGGLLAAACSGSDESPTTAATAPAPAPPEAPEPAPAPPEAPEPAPATPEPAPAPPEPSEDEPPPDTTATEEPAPATVGDEPAEDIEAESPAEDSATGEPEAESAEALSFPVTITSDGGTWTLESQPQRIVSLSPTATEILFAIGAGPQVVAVDNWSTYPPEAPTTDLSGFDPNIEAITAYEPDLVVIANDSNELVAGLTALDIPVLISPSPLDIKGGYASVETLGLATGYASEAAEVSGWMRSEIAAALADAPVVPIRIYHELDDTHFSVSSNSFLGAVYAALGTVNIADPADTDGYGYPQLTEEYVIEADPELIIITDLLAYGAEDVAARPGWETVTAVRDGNILVVDADIASRWGPRLPQFIGAVAEALATIAASS